MRRGGAASSRRAPVNSATLPAGDFIGMSSLPTACLHAVVELADRMFVREPSVATFARITVLTATKPELPAGCVVLRTATNSPSIRRI